VRCGDAILELWRRLGEPSDFNPGPCTTVAGIAAAGLPIRDALNQAQDVVASWKDAMGRRIRFRCLEDSFFFDSVIVPVDAFPAQSGGTSWKVLTLPATLTSGISNRFANWTLLFSDGRSFRVTQSNATTLTLAVAATTTTVAGLVATLSKRVYEINTGTTDAISYLRRKLELDEVIDLTQQVQLELAADDEHFVATAGTVSVPGLWSKRGGKIEFATAPTDVRSYEVRLTRYPRQCIGVDDNYELPDAFQQAMLLRGEWWGNGMLQEPQMAYAKKRDLVELMMQLRDEMDFESDHTQDSFRVRAR